MKKKVVLIFFSLFILFQKPLIADNHSAVAHRMKAFNSISYRLPQNFTFGTKAKSAALVKKSNRINIQLKTASQKAQITILDFGTQNIHTSSPAKSFTIRGNSLTGSVTISATPPFVISKDSVVYRSSIGYSLEEMVTNKKVYVKFNPTIAGNYSGSVSNLSEGAEMKFLTLTGIAVDPNSPINANQLVIGNLVTPNGDGKNDTWVIKNIDYYPTNTVKVFDKTGRIVYSKQGYTNDWNGTYNNAPLSQGTYFYVIEFGAGLGVYKGYITIVRD